MIRKATLQDLDRLDALALATILAMQAAGIAQWTENYPRKKHFQHDVERGALYVFEHDDDLLGAMVLYEENDPPYRSITWLRDRSIVLHRLLIAPNNQQRGIASALLDYALQYGKNNGYQSLKIDTHPANYKMRAFLKKHHFHELDYIAPMHRIGYERLIESASPRRIIILGSPGTGKTTLAKMLAKKLDLPYLHLDSVYWHKDWQAVDAETFARRMRAFTSRHHRYVMDGNYTNHLFIERLELADTIIILEYDLNMSLKGIIDREAAYKHRYRSDMAEGCLEQIDQIFLQYVYRFEKKLQKIIATTARYTGRKKLYRFKDRQSMMRWFSQL
ncbi:MAG: GNAT family N-acetyltransferase [Acholeplasmatales bacterium]|nr:MAG: GNAT family N-acetyltransferase [Acholeplasmatales bacterium]